MPSTFLADLLFPVEPASLLALVVVSFVAALVQGTIGFGFSMLSVPLLSLIDPRLAPVPQIVVSVFLSGLVFMREREHADLRGGVWVFVGQLPGALLGLAVLSRVSASTLDLVIGAIVLFAVLSVARGYAIRRTPLTKFLAGMASAASALLSSIGGPPLALVYHGVRGPEFRATLAMVFVVGSTLAVVSRGFAGEMVARDLALAVWGFFPMLMGVYLSKFLAARLEGQLFRVAVLVLVALTGAMLLGRALV